MLKTKSQIVHDWLPRYTGTPIGNFGQYIILTNFRSYLDYFSEYYNAPIQGEDNPMQTATSDHGVTMIQMGMGSPNMATICDLLAAAQPKSVIFLGKCGGLKSKLKLGDFILPIAAIRGEGTSDGYFPKEVPALPSFQMQKAISHIIMQQQLDYFTGTIYTTNRRVWEHDQEFLDYLKRTRCIGIDMETATFFIVCFANQIAHGSLLLVSDIPMTPEGIKTSKSDRVVSKKFMPLHVQTGVDALLELKHSGESIKHLVF